MRICLLLLALLISDMASADETRISPAHPDPGGWLVHEVVSEYQSAPTTIRVLLPEPLLPERPCRVVYALPVEAALESRYGDSLIEIRKQNLHQIHQVIVVAPSFAQLPWYADHPNDPGIRQETYFLNVVIPFIEKTYPVEKSPSGRLLLGFSKSGWGAWALLLRHPDRFAAALAWDAPLTMDWPSKYGSEPIFGSADNFALYRIIPLLRNYRDNFPSDRRLILTGFGGFRADHQEIHNLLDELHIPHTYRDGPERKHDWHSGWVAEGFPLLLETTSD